MRRFGDATAVKVCLYLASLLGTSPLFADDRMIALELSKKHREAVGLLQTFECKYTKYRVSATGQVLEQYPEIHYWRSGSSYRAEFTKNGQQCEFVLHDGLIKSLWNRTRPDKRLGSIDTDRSLPLTYGDPWLDPKLAILVRREKGPAVLTDLSEILQDQRYTVFVREDVDDGTACQVVRLEIQKVSFSEYWLAPKFNFMLKKYIVEFPDNNGKVLRQVSHITKFAEVEPGLFFPAKLDFTDFTNGKLDLRETSEYRELRINQNIPVAIFNLQFDPGTAISNRLEGVRYTLGRDGKTREQLIAIQPSAPTLLPTGSPHRSTTPSEPLRQTDRESRLFPIWLFLISGISLVISLGLLCLKRRSKKREVDSSEGGR